MAEQPRKHIMQRAHFGVKTNISWEPVDSAEDVSKAIEGESLDDALARLVQEQYQQFVKESYTNREKAILALIEKGLSLQEIVLEEYVGFPVLINEGVVDGMQRFTVRDRFWVRPMTEEEKRGMDEEIKRGVSPED